MLLKRVLILMLVAAFACVFVSCSDPNGTSIVDIVEKSTSESSSSVSSSSSTSSDTSSSETQSSSESSAASTTAVPDFSENLGIGSFEKKDYTVLIYMNTANVEERCLRASIDIEKILSSGVDTSSTNVLILAGKCDSYQNELLSGDTSVIYMLDGDKLLALTDLGSVDTRNADTLAGFINYAHKLTPAEKYGLVLWNVYDGDLLPVGGSSDAFSPTDLRIALNMSVALEVPFDFVMFDSGFCSNLETAYAVSDSSSYMIAAQEQIAGDGWDYSFLSLLSSHNSPAIQARIIAESFGAYYLANYPELPFAVSVIDLSRIGVLSSSLNHFAESAEALLTSGDSFLSVSQCLSRVKRLGEYGTHGCGVDMADITDMCGVFSELLPQEVKSVQTAVSTCVTYHSARNVHNTFGISVFFPLCAPDEETSLPLSVYSLLWYQSGYSSFLRTYSSLLLEFNGYPRDSLAVKKLNSGQFYITLRESELDVIKDVRFCLWQCLGEASSSVCLNLLSYAGSPLTAAENGRVTSPDTASLTRIGNANAVYSFDSPSVLPILYGSYDSDAVVEYNAQGVGSLTGCVTCFDDGEAGYPHSYVRFKSGDGVSILSLSTVCTQHTASGLTNDAAAPFSAGSPIKVPSGGLTAKQSNPDGKYKAGFIIRDIFGNVYFTNTINVEY